MGDRHDYVALDWVKPEIDEELKRARQALEAFVENPQDLTRMRFCLNHIHHVHGTLQMVEFYGAALLAEEMEALAQALLNNTARSITEAQEVLMQSILQLPMYLDRVQSGRRDLPVILLPILNDIRAARGEKLLSETSLFSPTLEHKYPKLKPTAIQKLKGESFDTLLKKLRQMYQFALIGVLRDQHMAENLNYMVKVFSRLEQLFLKTPLGQLWWIAKGVIEGIANGSIHNGSSVRSLLRQVEHEIKRVVDEGPEALNEPAPDDLIKNLLYYVAKSDNETQRIREIKDKFNLDDALPSEQTIIAERDALAGPDKEAVGSVVEVLIEELVEVKEALDLFVRDANKEAEHLKKQLPTLKRISDTVGVLGLGIPRKVLVEQTEIIEALANNERPLEDNTLMDVAGALLYVEATLSGMLQEPLAKEGEEGNEALIPASKITEVHGAVIREARNGLEQGKDAIIEFIASQWDHEKLKDVPLLLDEVRGGLAMIPLERASILIAACQRYVQLDLLVKKAIPQWQALDTLADAITSVEYYLERLTEDNVTQNELILDVAEESLMHLGFSKSELRGEEPLAPVVIAREPEEVEEEEEFDVEGLISDEMKPGKSVAKEELPVELEAEEEITADELPELPEEAEAVEEIEFTLEDEALEAEPVAEEQTIEEALVEAAPAAEVEEEEDDLIDDEVIEIFIEEAGEVQETIAEFFPQWQANPGDNNALTEVRRSFHTLKGSGRLVGATIVGELAWSVENMLNRVIDGTIETSEVLFSIIERVRLTLPSLVDDFEHRRQKLTPLAESLMAEAEAYSKGLPYEAPAHIDEAEGVPTQKESQAAEAEEAAAPSEKTGGSSAEELEDTEEVDPILLEIFQNEAESHIKTVGQFIDHCRAYNEPQPISDELPRALHTLKGSAHMAGVEPIALLAGPLETLVVDLRNHMIKADEEVVNLLDEANNLFEASVPQAGKTIPFSQPQLEAFLNKVAQLQQEKITKVVEGELLGEPREATGFSFLTEGMELLLDAGEILHQWSQKPVPGDELNELISELASLIEGAEEAELYALAELCEALRDTYIAVLEGRISLSEQFFQVVKDAHEQLIGMMDNIAAVQSVEPAKEQVQQLTQLLETAAPTSISDMEEETIELGEMPTLEVDTGIDFDLEAKLTAAEEGLDAEYEGLEEPSNEDLIPEDANLADLAIEEEIVIDEPEEEQSIAEGGAEPTEEEIAKAEFRDPELVEIFLEEANDIMESTATSLHKWIEDPSSMFEVEELQRDLHTLKGGARMAEITEIGDLSHELEFLYEGLSDGRLKTAQPLFDLLLECHDRLADMLDELRNTNFCRPADDLIACLHAFRTHPEAGVPDLKEFAKPKQPEKKTVATEQVKPVTPQEVPTVAVDLDDLSLADEDVLEIFLDEASEIVESIEHTADNWSKEPTAAQYADELLRHLHTLKGGARLAGLSKLGNYTHDFELFITQAQNKLSEIEPSFFKEVMSRQDILLVHADAVKAYMKGEQPVVHSVSEELVQPAFEVTEEEGELLREEASADIIPFTPPRPAEGRQLANGMPAKVSPISKAQQMLQSSRRAPQEMVKVPADLLESLVNLAGETSITRGRVEQQISDISFTLEEMHTTIERVREQLRRLDMETQAQIISKHEADTGMHMLDFDPLEMDEYSELTQLSRSLFESASDLMDLKDALTDKNRDAETLLLQQSRVNTELQEGLMQTRMVPFSRLLPRLRRIVRQVSTELGKRVEFNVLNAEGEMDRTVLERMVAPLEHMLRNAVDHGIESEEARANSGKEPVGHITLSLSREGGNVMLELADDGNGVNIEAVRAKAIERGLMDADADLSDSEIMQFILEAGFSTAKEVTQISGRGVGMDVVHSEIKQLGGNVVIQSEPGQGTTFVVRLPFTVSVNRALMVYIGDDLYAIPLNSIEGVVRVSPYELEAYYEEDAPDFEYAGQDYKLRYLGDILHKRGKPNLQGVMAPLPVILTRGAEHTVALQVDSLAGSREIVVKTLGAQFALVNGVSGATILGDGRVVIILDLVALIRTDYAHHALAPTGVTIEAPVEEIVEEVEEAKIPTVMVVDDSVTVRKVTSRLLERNGYEVMTAKDGVEAIAQLQDRKPDVMLLDIEMPRMDGFEVASTVRNDRRLKNLPIIMITSRTGEKHRERAMSIGVNEYLGKPFQEGPLLETIEKMVNVNG
ncbi:Hpt domain-containing protein [Endozoicomonas sp. SM1973]|uniref:Chemotaxis protein CheA n=1 Tax=Spartinivicinus marinus TaxID=2994442 RepID=A0A853HVR0_9GAMM|nr:Hpt domain-containing protein [Spartinivicinus marinus]MCX4026665.1 Hpt domain-containing protein [Spartinivicinus marinus]NYZ64499.1 Hpt domain-containing protein [Spartinivicinus marinus]